MPKREPIHMLADWTEVRAIADPLRMLILQELGKKPMTTFQVAKALGEKPTKLYHHMEILEAAGLVRMIEARQNRGFIEKFYEPIADDFAIDSNLVALTSGQEKASAGYEALFLSAIQATLAEARQAAARGLVKKGQARMYRVALGGSEAEVQALLAKIDALVQESGMDPKEPRYNLTIAFFPTKPARTSPKEASAKQRSHRI